MMEEGLAARAVQPQPGMGQQAPQVSVEEVIQLLMQGVDPEVLVQKGVPMEIVRQAVEMILAQEQQAQAQASGAQTQAGQQMTRGM